MILIAGAPFACGITKILSAASCVPIIGSFDLGCSLTDPAKINALQHVAVEKSRLHIPILFAFDTIHGYRTIFPIPLGAASSFDPSVATADDTIAARDHASNGEIHHCVTFKVADLERAEEYLTAKGIKVLDRDDRTLITDPATTHGVPFRWTTWVVPGDPRA